MDLSGDWLATVVDDDVRRSILGDGRLGQRWETVQVPGHWRDHAAFADADGPIMYRTTFDAAPPAADRRRWLVFDGLFYQADVWLDGAYLGDPEGYFFPHEFDVTALSRLAHEHVLAVELHCAAQLSAHDRHNITGVLQGDPTLGADANPGGIWRAVRVVDTGPVRIDRMRILCRDADERRAHLRIAARVDSDRTGTIVARTLLDGEVRHEHEHGVAAGENELEWSIDVTDPSLWWPHALGPSHLVDVEIEVDFDGAVSDRHRRRTGLRQVEWDNWTLSVNGERLFLKGANLFPTRMGLANASSDDVRADVERADALGLDALRVHGHVGRPELYDAADELGMILLQDFPLQWGYARSVRREAVHQARAAVDVLGHHPSIALWNAHDDPTAEATITPTGSLGRIRRLAAGQLPSWNRTVLDRWVKRSFERVDPTRTTIAHSGVPPHLPLLDGTDSHLSLGWRRGDADGLARLAARLPRVVRFVSDFGGDSVPTTAPYLDEQAARLPWPEMDWQALAETHGYDREVFERRLAPWWSDDLDAWRDVSQRYQAHLLKVQIETLRRLKYRPTGGFCFSRLNDPAPLISSSVIDHAGVPKAAYDAVAAACAPVLVVADQPPAEVTAGTRLRLEVHLINDLRTPIDAAVVDAVVRWPRQADDTSAPVRFRFGGPVDADAVVKVGTIVAAVPDTPGDAIVELELSAGDLRGSNRYATTVVARAD